MLVEGRHYLSPRPMGSGPGVEHEAWNREDIFYVTTYIERDL
jgi:hypothetical protein